MINKELTNTIISLTESNEENKDILEKMDQFDPEKRIEYTKETADVFSSVIYIFLLK